MMSRIPKTYRYVDETEATSSLIRPEAMSSFGLFYEDGGESFDSHEAAEQYVKMRKAGWRIINDGQFANQSIHLCQGAGWGAITSKRHLSNFPS
jgi:hypothetical protein